MSNVDLFRLPRWARPRWHRHRGGSRVHQRGLGGGWGGALAQVEVRQGRGARSTWSRLGNPVVRPKKILKVTESPKSKIALFFRWNTKDNQPCEGKHSQEAWASVHLSNWILFPSECILIFHLWMKQHQSANDHNVCQLLQSSSWTMQCCFKRFYSILGMDLFLHCLQTCVQMCVYFQQICEWWHQESWSKMTLPGIGWQRLTPCLSKVYHYSAFWQGLQEAKNDTLTTAMVNMSRAENLIAKWMP